MGSGTLGTLALGGDSGPESRVLPSAVGIQLRAGATNVLERQAPKSGNGILLSGKSRKPGLEVLDDVLQPLPKEVLWNHASIFISENSRVASRTS
jgi:hypothetical protein